MDMVMMFNARGPYCALWSVLLLAPIRGQHYQGCWDPGSNAQQKPHGHRHRIATQALPYSPANRTDKDKQQQANKPFHDWCPLSPKHPLCECPSLLD